MGRAISGPTPLEFMQAYLHFKVYDAEFNHPNRLQRGNARVTFLTSAAAPPPSPGLPLCTNNQGRRCPYFFCELRGLRAACRNNS